MQRMGLIHSCFEPVASLFGIRGSLPAIRHQSSAAHIGQTGGCNVILLNMQHHPKQQVICVSGSGAAAGVRMTA